ncbi:MAG: pilus assembly protein [Planctomycetota bacterium]|nr:pilus assembly protein [Planctomycetota bacterium]
MIRAIWNRISEIAREEESGQAMTEFVIVAPVQFLVIAGIMQFALFNTAVIVVNHAAYTAARAALVGDESPGVGSQGMAERAAIFICSSIAGSSDVAGGASVSYPGPNGRATLARSAAAASKTRVKINYNQDGQAVQAIVTHEYELAIPVVRHLFKTPGLPYRTPHVAIREDCIMPCPWGRRR